MSMRCFCLILYTCILFAEDTCLSLRVFAALSVHWNVHRIANRIHNTRTHTRSHVRRAKHIYVIVGVFSLSLSFSAASCLIVVVCICGARSCVKGWQKANDQTMDVCEQLYEKVTAALTDSVSSSSVAGASSVFVLATTAFGSIRLVALICQCLLLSSPCAWKSEISGACICFGPSTATITGASGCSFECPCQPIFQTLQFATVTFHRRILSCTIRI